MHDEEWTFQGAKTGTESTQNVYMLIALSRTEEPPEKTWQYVQLLTILSTCNNQPVIHSSPAIVCLLI